MPSTSQSLVRPSPAERAEAAETSAAAGFEAAREAQEELARQRDRLELLLEVNNALVSNLEPSALFAEIARRLRRVVAHDYTSLAVHQPERNAFDMWALVSRRSSVRPRP